jgi:hypothetical protein
MSAAERDDCMYGRGRQEETRARHAMLLWEAGFIKGIDANSFSGPALLAPELTWEGHNLLDTLRSKPVWEKIKSTASEKGIELSFDAVIALGKAVLANIIGGS